MSISIVVIAGILFLVLIAAFVGWLFLRNSGSSARINDTTEHVIQQFCSSDLKKRVFVLQRNDSRYKVVFQVYSNRIINQGGEVEGWKTLREKKVTDSLAMAVEIAQTWAHTEDD